LSKSIYTSGLSGFIGKNLLPHLLTTYDQIINFERDNRASVYSKSGKKSIEISEELSNQYSAEHLIHLATLYRPNSKSIDELNEVYQSNVKFILDIVEGFFQKQEIEIINISSYMQLLDIKYQNSYSLSKEIVSMFLKDNNYRHKNIYLFDSFGTNDIRNKVTDTFIRHVIANNDIRMPANDISINLSYVDDVCYSIFKAIDLPEGNYSIMSENSITLLDLSKMIMKALSREVRIERSGIAVNYLDEIRNLPKNIFVCNESKSLAERLNERIDEIAQT